MSESHPETGEPLYSPDYYDADYYGRGARGGFKSYDYASAEQREQLALKDLFLDAVPHDSALFVGCARGFEVAHAFERGKRAAGVDVSRWAIANAIPEAAGSCSLCDGRSLAFASDSFDLVASFDVLHHLPDAMLSELAAEIVRVARRGIVFRLVVKSWRDLEREIDGRDGAWLRYRRLEFWDELLSRSGKFELDWLKMHFQHEVTAIYRRAK